eukprot:COSAG02_NODE_9_length_59728_cov_36.104714_34_plen_223_part_00
MEARKKSDSVASDSKPAKSPASTTSYSPALGVNIPAGTRRPQQSKSTKATPTALGRARKSKAASDEATTNSDGYRQGDKVVFASFCPHRDRGMGTVVYSSRSGICVAFDTDGGKSQEWVYNEFITRPGTARGSTSRKSTGGTVVKQKAEAQDAGLALVNLTRRSSLARFVFKFLRHRDRGLLVHDEVLGFTQPKPKPRPQSRVQSGQAPDKVLKVIVLGDSG